MCYKGTGSINPVLGAEDSKKSALGALQMDGEPGKTEEERTGEAQSKQKEQDAQGH